MDAKEVISSIDSIYEKFDIPPNLCLHMYRAASIAEMICDNWKGPEINRDDIIAITLIHDLGNIVKFDFDSEVGKEALGAELMHIDHWREVKQRTIKKYGANDHEVTYKMAEELGVNERMHNLLKNGGFAFGKALEHFDNWDFKIHIYTDFRTGPLGIMSVADRLNEFRKRSIARSRTIDNFDELVKAALALEKNVLANTPFKPEEINDQTIRPYLDKYLK